MYSTECIITLRLEGTRRGSRAERAGGRARARAAGESRDSSGVSSALLLN